MKNKGQKKKTLLFILVIVSFIILLVFWQLYLKIFSGKKEQNKGDSFLLELFDQGGEAKKDLQNMFEKIKNLGLSNFSNEELGNKTTPEEVAVSQDLSVEEKEKIKEKILEYINQREK